MKCSILRCIWNAVFKSIVLVLVFNEHWMSLELCINNTQRHRLQFSRSLELLHCHHIENGSRISGIWHTHRDTGYCTFLDVIIYGSETALWMWALEIPKMNHVIQHGSKEGSSGVCLLGWLYQVQLYNPISAAHCCREVVCSLICSCDTGCISICFTAALNVKTLYSSQAIQKPNQFVFHPCRGNHT